MIQYPDSSAEWKYGCEESGFLLCGDLGMMQLEICVDSIESAMAAEAGGAQRVELCSALSEGGLTPSLGLIRAVRERVGIGVYVMIRPRSGDFFYSEDECAVMRDDIAHAVRAGAHGVVLGVLTRDGDVDMERTRRLVDAASGMEVTFHRALDMVRDMEAALEDVVRSGAQRVLTSGGAQSAMKGSKRIAALVKAARGRIGIMTGGGVRAENVLELAQVTGAREFHAALRTRVASPVARHNPALSLGEAGHDEYARRVVLADDVRRLREAMNAIESDWSTVPVR